MIEPIRTTKVFSKNAIAFAEGKRYLINQGGTSSSKTWSILHLLKFIAESVDGIMISVCSETMPHLKRGALRDFVNILKRSGQYDENFYNKTDKIFTFGKSQIEFFSADSGVIGSRRDILYCNEVDLIPEETFDHMITRTNRAIFCDFNPRSEFYIHQNLINNPKKKDEVAFIKSTYKDNTELNANIIAEIESRRDVPKYANWWKVYGLGEIGSLEGVVFEDWAQVDSMPDSDRRGFGIDFGFTNDPTTIVEVRISDGDLYIDEHAYQTGMMNGDIASILRSLAIPVAVPIVADSADPKTIKDLNDRGHPVKGAEKGADSIRAGISHIKSFRKIYVTKRSLNVIKELRNYVWAKDTSGKTTNEPIEYFNHTIDAIRYIVSHLVGKGAKIRPARFNF